MEDPLFDPWGPVAGPPRAEAEKDRREPLGETDAIPARVLDRQSTETRARWSRGTVTRGVSPARPVPRPAVATPSALPEIDTPDGPLRAFAVPAIEAVAGRLQLARHRTRFDDRLDRNPPSVRFQLLPWIGPFDDPKSATGPALEISLDEQEGMVVARLWLDPLAESSGEERRIPATEIRRRWIDELLLHFVRKGLEI